MKKRAVAFDVGSHTIGVAQSDVLKMFAHPVQTFRYLENKWDQALDAIFEQINIQEIDTYVVGFPKTLKNNESESTKRATRFGSKLEKYLSRKTQGTNEPSYEVVYFDERLSTHAAENILLNMDMKRKKRKKVIDTVAAVVILDNYLGTLK